MSEHFQPDRRRLLLLGAGTLAGLGGCGGGVEVGGTGTSPDAFASGPITGFGSIVVNGVHFDETQAGIVADDGRSLTAADLRLGMNVGIVSGQIDRNALTAVAKQVTLRTDLLGPVSANDAAAGTLTVLGQTVRVTASTVFDDRLSGGQAAVTVGSLLRVYAIYDPVSGVYAARRLEPVSSAGNYRIRGQVSALDTAAKTFRIGTAVFVYTTAPANLGNGQQVQLTLDTTPDGQGRWVVGRLGDDSKQIEDGAEVELESVIASYTSLSDFTVSGIQVNAASARISPAGAVLAAGVRIEVEGTYAAGVLVARTLEVKAAEDGGDGGSGDGVEYEIESRITSLDTAAKTFVVKSGSQKVSYANATFKGGTEAKLAVDVKVHVHGTLSEDGTLVDASEIEFDT